MSTPTSSLLTWQYTPSLIPSIIATVVFTIITLLYITFFIRNRNKPTLPFIFAAFNEAGGYLFRALAHTNTTSDFFYQIQLVLLLISPVMMSTGLYAVFTNMMASAQGANVGAASGVGTRKRTRLAFTILDILAILVITVGASMATRSEGSAGTFVNVLKAGLALHLAIFLTFVALVTLWQRRLTHQITMDVSMPYHSSRNDVLFLYSITVFLIVRNCGRIAEYSMGQDGYIAQHEWVYYFIDPIQMAFAMVLCLKWCLRRGKDVGRPSDAVELTSSDAGSGRDPARGRAFV